MNRLKEISASTGLAVCCIALLAAVALSVPMWLGFGGTVQASSHPGNAGGRAGQTMPMPTPAPSDNPEPPAAQNGSVNSETGTAVKSSTDGSSPYTLSSVSRDGQSRGRPCPDSSRAHCGEGDSPASVAALSGPGIAIAGLTGAYIAGDTDDFSVTISDPTLNQLYTVTFTTSHSSIGFNFRCNYFPTGSFTPASLASVAETLNFTFHACKSPGGTITAQLRQGNAQGAIVATATAAVTVTAATGSLSPTPAAITVGKDQTFTLTTNVPDSTGVWITATAAGDTGRTTLPPTQGCSSASSGRAAVNGNTITLRGCRAGQTTLNLYRSNSIIPLDSYTVTVNPSDTSLSPAPAALTVGHDQTFTLNTGVPNDPGVYVTATYFGDTGRLALPPTRGCFNASSGLAAVNGNTLTLRGCQPGTATITIYRSNSSVLLKSYTVTVNASDTSLSPAPAALIVGHDQTFTLNTGVPNDPGVYVTATYFGDTGRLALPPTRGCFNASSGLAAVNGNTLTLRGCQPGTATITIYRSNSSVLLKSYTVIVNPSTTSLSPAPAAITVGQDLTFTLTTDAPNNPGVWITATIAGDPGRTTLPPDWGCHSASSGLAAVNGNTITLRGCQAGTATITIYRSNSSVLLKSYTVIVNASTTGLSPVPAAITVGQDLTFTLTTDIPSNPGVYVTATLSGDTGRLTLPPTESCLYSSSGIAAVNGNTVTLRGCRPGTATITLYRSNSSVLLESYTVIVNASTTSLSPAPAAITVGHDQTFTLTTDIPSNPGVWITATIAGDTGRLTLPPTRGCFNASSGLAAVNGNTITLRGCQPGTATITIYRSNSSVLLASYTVNVAASNTSLSPPPATFTVGTNQTFTLTTDIPNTPGVWVGLNYNSADTGRLVLPNQDCSVSSAGTAAVNGNSITLKPCTAGTATIKVGRSNSGVFLVTYTVTINSS